MLANSPGSWSVSGSRFSMNFTSGVENIEYTLTGNQFTMSYPDTLGGANVSHRMVLQRM
jgi:hypothetical protein